MNKKKIEVPAEEAKAFVHPKMPIPCPLIFRSAGEVLDAPVVDLAWILERHIPRGRVGVLGAVSDHGKTFLALQLAAAIASATPLFGIPTSTTPLGTLFLTFEDTEPEDLSPRLNAILEADRILGRASLHAIRERVVFASPNFQGGVSPVSGLAAIREALEGGLTQMKGKGIEPGLVVVDTFNAVAEQAEEKAEVAARVWGIAREIASRHQVTVLFIHHVKKDGLVGKGRNPLLDRVHPTLLRGHSSNEGAARFIAMMGWITAEEAEGVGLDPDTAFNLGYAFLRIAKLKHEKPDMIFLERIPTGEPGAGTWKMRPDGPHLLAQLARSKQKLEALDFQDQVLLMVCEGRTDEEIANRLYPALPDGKKKVGRVMSNLRNKMRWIQSGRSRTPTAEGLARVQALRAEMDASDSSLPGRPGEEGLEVREEEDCSSRLDLGPGEKSGMPRASNDDIVSGDI